MGGGLEGVNGVYATDIYKQGEQNQIIGFSVTSNHFVSQFFCFEDVRGLAEMGLFEFFWSYGLLFFSPFQYAPINT